MDLSSSWFVQARVSKLPRGAGAGFSIAREGKRNLRSGVLFSGERESVAAGESAVGRREKKGTPDTITGRVVCRPLFAYVTFLCHAFKVSQSDLTGNKYIFS